MEFRFLLALQLGKTVAELSQTLTAAEENMWVAYHKRSPMGDERADLRSAQIAQILWNANVKKDKAKDIYAFMPFHRKKQKKDPNVNQSVRNVFSKLIKKKD